MLFWILFQRIIKDFKIKHMLSEKEFIKKFIKPLGDKKGRNSFDFEDDVAVVNNYAYSTDTIAENIHFFKKDKPQYIAKKLIRVNVSDLLAKGVRPEYCLFNFSAGKIVNKRWISSFIDSFNSDLKKYQISLIGGDTVNTKARTLLSLTIFGKIPSQGIKLRSSAKKSDFIYVSGTIGDSSIGMNLIKKKIRFDKKSKENLILRYQIPHPSIDLLKLIQNKANASTDISDGLLIDLNNICEMSNLGAEISFSQIPKSSDVKRFISKNINYEKLILTGGDDYQILFTGPKGLDKYKNVTNIGKMTKEKGIKIIDKNFRDLIKGYSHLLY